jgi:prevent-host-death family protein
MVVKTLPISEAKAKLAELVDVVSRRDESVAITRNGHPVAMLVSTGEYESWRETLEILSDEELAREIREGIRSLARTRKRHTLDELFPD